MVRINILIGGKAGQGINKISEIVSRILVNYGYFTFNYRDYPSLIRGGHNFNVLCISDKRVGSIDSKFEVVIGLDDKTLEIHKDQLKKDGTIITDGKFKNLGRNLNLALAGCLIKILGVEKNLLIDEIENQFHNNEATKAAEIGYDSEKEKFNLKKLGNKISLITGNHGIVAGAINSGINLYIGYPMTPATGVLHEFAGMQNENFKFFLPENEIAAVNQALGASFTGSRVMTGTSGGGFDLMTEGLSFQGMSEIPLVVYLASRPGPGTGVPTYSMQDDLNVALRGGHGEFPRVVIAPGDANECIEKTNESFYLAEKFNSLSIILSDKHLAEGEFSTDRKPNKIIPVKTNRKFPGNNIVKANSYEHNANGESVENEGITKTNADKRIKKYEEIKKEIKNKNFQMIKIYGNKNAKNLVIGWGSTKTVILDALDSIDASIRKIGNYKFLQVLYLKPLSEEIKQEIEKTEKAGGKVILIEQNVTGQLGRLIREKTGISIKNKILKYDGRPFYCDELREEILKIK